MAAVTDLPGGQPAKKVLASTIGAGGGAVTAGLILYLLDVLVYTGEGSTPMPVMLFVLFWVTTGPTYIAGYLTPRGLEEVTPPQRRGDHEAD